MRTALLKIYDDLTVYFSSADLPQVIFPLKIISSVISSLLLIAIISLIFKIREQLKKPLEMIADSVAEKDMPEKVIVQKWQSVLDKLTKEDQDSYKLAVIEADKIFDDLLKRIGYQGKDMGERLKQLTPAQLSNLDEVWQAHKVRNQIAHQPDFKITRAQAQRAVEIYQRALEDLEAL